VRVRVGTAHHRALVLEDLDVADEIALAQVASLLGPGIHHAADVARLHLGQRQVVARAEADHPADPALALDAKQRVIVRLVGGRAGQQRGKIIVENERARVVGVAVAPGALVAGTQVAVRIVPRAGIGRRILDLALPGPFGAVR